MSGGGTVISARGGIDVRTEDLRAAAQIVSDLGSTVRQQVGELQAKALQLPSLMYLPNPITVQLECAGVSRARGAADTAVRLSRSLRTAAESYDSGESRIEWMAGDAVAVLKNGLKAYVGYMSGGLLDTPYDYDPRMLEALTALAGMAGLDTLVTRMAAILDWRGQPVVKATGIDTSAAGTAPPRSATDLLEGVERLGASGDSDVGVQFLEYDDGRPRQVIVSLPGTSQWTPGTDIPTDVTAGLLAVKGLPTSYSNGVIEMLELAGVTAADHILLVGHSLGGMVAAHLAQQLSGSGRFTVTTVVTAGSPIARIDIPDDVRALALENKDDPVPHVDGAPNEDSGNVVTVTVDTAASGLDSHYLNEGYVPAAEAVTNSDIPQIQHALEGLQPFLEADRTTTRTYTIARP